MRNSNNIENKKFRTPTRVSAFTLAEILVTLLIIGVVAAMTIPTLINKIQDAQYKSLLKKQVAVASDVFRRAAVDNGGSLVGYSSKSGDDCRRANDFRDVVKPYLSWTKSCDVSKIVPCSPVSEYKTFTDGAFPVSWPSAPKYGNCEAALNLNDGSLWWFHANYANMGTCTSAWIVGNNNSCGNISIDTNGAKGPNKAGYDFFEFYVASDGTLIPLGSASDLFRNGISKQIGYNPIMMQMLDIIP